MSATSIAPATYAPPCTKGYTGGIVSYELIVSCGEVINLVTIAGDDPKDADIACDNALDHAQLALDVVQVPRPGIDDRGSSHP